MERRGDSLKVSERKEGGGKDLKVKQAKQNKKTPQNKT